VQNRNTLHCYVIFKLMYVLSTVNKRSVSEQESEYIMTGLAKSVSSTHQFTGKEGFKSENEISSVSRWVCFRYMIVHSNWHN
jgi:hypothetical protein